MLFGRKKKIVLQAMARSLNHDMNNLHCAIVELAKYCETIHRTEALNDLTIELANIQQKLDWDCRDITEKIDEL